MQSRRIVACVAVLTVSLWVNAQGRDSTRATADEVFRKVQIAALLIEDHGEQALEMIADPALGFRWKDTYVFVVDCGADKVMLNLAFPERVGGDIKQHTDYAGNRYGRDLCNTADAGEGWIEYVWLRPGDSEPVRKLSYVKAPDGSPFTVGAGIYDDRRSIAELNAVFTAD